MLRDSLYCSWSVFVARQTDRQEQKQDVLNVVRLTVTVLGSRGRQIHVRVKQDSTDVYQTDGQTDAQTDRWAGSTQTDKHADID